MSQPPITVSKEAILKRIQDDRAKVEARLGRSRRLNGVLLGSNITLSALATALAGIAAASGKPMGALAWPAFCASVAGVTFLATVSGTFNATFGVSNHVKDSKECAVGLRVLEEALTIWGKSPEEVWKAYDELRGKHTDCFV